MEEISSLKRPREESLTQEMVEQPEEDVFKRQKSYKDIITLLEEEEDEPNEDVSSLISTLQEEISSSSSPSSSEPDPARSGPYEADQEVPSGGTGSGSGSEEEEKESVMRHLLEASDDELGLPNTASNVLTDGFDEVVRGQVDAGDLFLPVGGEGLWEFEDYEAANYYSLLQSEIFL